MIAVPGGQDDRGVGARTLAGPASSSWELGFLPDCCFLSTGRMLSYRGFPTGGERVLQQGTRPAESQRPSAPFPALSEERPSAVSRATAPSYRVPTTCVRCLRVGGDRFTSLSLSCARVGGTGVHRSPPLEPTPARRAQLSLRVSEVTKSRRNLNHGNLRQSRT